MNLPIQPDAFSVPPVAISSSNPSSTSSVYSSPPANSVAASAPTSERSNRKPNKVRHRQLTDMAGVSEGGNSTGAGIPANIGGEEITRNRALTYTGGREGAAPVSYGREGKERRSKKKRLSAKDQERLSGTGIPLFFRNSIFSCYSC